MRIRIFRIRNIRKELYLHSLEGSPTFFMSLRVKTRLLILYVFLIRPFLPFVPVYLDPKRLFLLNLLENPLLYQDYWSTEKWSNRGPLTKREKPRSKGSEEKEAKTLKRTIVTKKQILKFEGLYFPGMNQVAVGILHGNDPSRERTPTQSLTDENPIHGWYQVSLD